MSQWAMVTSMLEWHVFEMPMGWCATGSWWSSSRLELVQYPRPWILIVAVIGLDSWDSTNMEFAIQRGMEVNFDALIDPRTRLQQLKETFINMGVSIHHLHSSNRLVKF